MFVKDSQRVEKLCLCLCRKLWDEPAGSGKRCSCAAGEIRINSYHKSRQHRCKHENIRKIETNNNAEHESWYCEKRGKIVVAFLDLTVRLVHWWFIYLQLRHTTTNQTIRIWLGINWMMWHFQTILNNFMEKNTHSPSDWTSRQQFY